MSVLSVTPEAEISGIYPVIRETISYRTGAADGLKDVLIITKSYIALATISQLAYLPNPFDDNYELDVSRFRAFKSSFPKFITRIDDVIQVEVSPNKTTGNFLMGNKRYGYELHVEARLPSGLKQTFGFFLYDNGSHNVLDLLQNILHNKIQLDVTKHTINVKSRISFFRKYSGLICWITTVGIVWSFYRYMRHIVFRTPSSLSKNTKNKEINPLLGSRLLDKPITTPLIGKTFKIIGIIAFLIAFINNEGFAVLLSSLYDFKTISGSSLLFIFFTSFVSSYVLPVISLICIYLGYRLALPVFEKKYTSTKSKLLFLRSFDEDGLNTFFRDPLSSVLLSLDVPYLLKWMYRGWLGWIANYHVLRNLRMIFSVTRDSAEEQFTSFFNRFGQVVAIGKPGEVLKQGGAVRMYVSHEAWQTEVRQLIGEVDLVLMQPGETQGVWWEMETLFAMKPPQHILFSLVNFRHLPGRYEQFKYRFEQQFSGLLKKPLPPKMPDEHFLYLDAWGVPHILPSYYSSPFVWPRRGYDIDFEKTLSPFLYGQEPAKQSIVKPTSRISWWSVLAATFIWLFSVVVLFGSAYVLSQRLLYPTLVNEVDEGTNFNSGSNYRSQLELFPTMVILMGKLAEKGRIYQFNRNKLLWPTVINDTPLTKDYTNAEAKTSIHLELRPSMGQDNKPDIVLKNYLSKIECDTDKHSKDTLTYNNQEWSLYWIKATGATCPNRTIWLHQDNRLNTIMDIQFRAQTVSDSTAVLFVEKSLQQLTLLPSDLKW